MPIEPANHTATSTAEYQLGSRYSRWDATYGYQEWMYVQNNGAVAAVAGSIARVSDQGLGTVTCDINDDQLGTTGSIFGGVFLVACAADYYTFVCTGGRFPDAKGDNAVAAGEPIVANADSVCDTAATLEYGQIFGYALEAFATDTLGDIFIKFGQCG